jgi:hypothetical protein
MNTQKRIQLAMAACEGLSDEELAQRGTGSFKKMIERKRAYSKTSKELLIAGNCLISIIQELTIKNNKAAAQTKVAVETIAAMDADLPKDYSSNITVMLSKIFATKKD